MAARAAIAAIIAAATFHRLTADGQLKESFEESRTQARLSRLYRVLISLRRWRFRYVYMNRF